MGHYPKTKEVYLPPAKGYTRGEDGFPSQEFPQRPGVVDGVATDTATSTLPTGGGGCGVGGGGKRDS